MTIPITVLTVYPQNSHSIKFVPITVRTVYPQQRHSLKFVPITVRATYLVYIVDEGKSDEEGKVNSNLISLLARIFEKLQFFTLEISAFVD